MRIDTCNHGGRAIPRADRALFPQYLGYRLATPGEPTLTVSLEGFDGKRYTVLLTDADCDAIKMAREKYAEQGGRSMTIASFFTGFDCAID